MSDLEALAARVEAKDVAAIAAGLDARYGKGCSSGVHAILMHDDLPEQFDKSHWSEWFFKPADAAFATAHDMGLIVPWRLSSKWVFTPLGHAVRTHYAHLTAGATHDR